MASPRHNRARQRDWEAIDFVIAFRDRGLTWKQVSEEAGYKGTALRNAVDKPWPKAEKAIAHALGLQPETIWPSRYARRQAAA
ncbi:helix-turn-helix domain-containing protein [Falsiroseomonas sp.]|uniref:helix-turn-helix domain-containing protein n=1 Tax=Falsiroseomonas sp. TaxID=2870721 RepID=UPI003F72132E